ncbi:Tripartite tricarboxylate transporter family receptor [Pigmentiphaga humi]|uniref:Tripartite tricarboxylate transporter family receptor n=1 Tax=Pigmentiphaga humi TaxID=2478468 RepID=A0A3P4B5A5_9BURK|nr:tripartite tricarboxylate transporter substrate binding protein [Pigmentiphaga humi]VCU71467.1 Tripartite tricarboxylate transporter family receptor [Pigmentiphaga humi]
MKTKKWARLPAWLTAVCAVLSGPAAHAASAAGYPSRPITLIVPTAPGGGADFMARVLAQTMTRMLGETVVVENRGGAGGTIGSSHVAKAAPDGYTLLLGYIGTHGTNPALGKLPYDAVADFAPISLIADAQTAILVHPSVKAGNLAELIALAKANPGQLNFASSGKGSMPHVAGIMFGQLTGTSIVPIHYRGSGPALSDTVANRTQLMFGTLVSASQYIRDGRLKALAVTGTSRSALFPDVPTVIESGLKGFEVPQWYGVLAPANTPPDIVRKLNATVHGALADPDTAKRFADQGSDIRTSTPEAFKAFIGTEITRWTEVTRSANITAD